MNDRILTPRRIVEELDRHIVGQPDAKKAVAIALRNRYRRKQLSDELREEVLPKNILMIGSTGVGKTEIARRLAKLVNAPFLKVEATKYTEVGYVGRDVESIIRDLVEISIRNEKKSAREAVHDKIEREVSLKLARILRDGPLPERPQQGGGMELLGMSHIKPGVAGIIGFVDGSSMTVETESASESRNEENYEEIEAIARKVCEGYYDDCFVEIDVEETAGPVIEVFGNAGHEDMGVSLPPGLQNLFGGKKSRKKVKVKRAREILEEEESSRHMEMDDVIRHAIDGVENSGIVFVDEIDKIVGAEGKSGPDVSREGVQRDLLPLIEGGTVMTKYGSVKTHHILFIAAGAFHNAKPNDLIPELQGRFPIRVELESLQWEDFLRILTEPECSLVKQYTALLAVDGIQLVFGEGALEEAARFAHAMNDQVVDIGARRLYTIVEKILETISFEASEKQPGEYIVTAQFVHDTLQEIAEDEDLSSYIL